MMNKRDKNQRFLFVRQNDKRGQIAIFIIIAVILIASVGVYFFIVKPGALKTTTEKSDSPIYAYAEECIESSIFKSVEAFGLQQGYYIVPEDKSLDTSFYRIAYYYLEGETLIPENDFFEKEFSKIINDKILEQCSDFSFFEEEGYEINANIEGINSETRISEEKLEVNVYYPIFTRTNESSTSFSEFSYDLSLRIGHVVDVSRTLVEKIKEEPSVVDLTFLLNQDVDISIVDYDECNKIYIIIDENSTINEEPYAFSFAVGFEKQYCSGEESEQ